VFGPIFFIGAMSGGAFRALSELLLPGLTGRAARTRWSASVPFSGVHAGAADRDLSPVRDEGSYEIALPALITSILAVMIAGAIEPESIDTLGLAAPDAACGRRASS